MSKRIVEAVMRLIGWTAIVGLLIAAVQSPAGMVVRGQSGVKSGAEALERDPELEKKAEHNVEVAEYYLKRRKAYKAAIDRLREIVEIYPEYTRFDKVLFLLAEAQVGYAKPDEAKENYERLLKDFPESEYVKQARKRLEKLK